MPLLIGTSGWQYRDWRGPVYTRGVPARLWLEEYTARFVTVENNNAFYRLPERARFESWRERTPEGFSMAVKASRYLTHFRRLRDPGEPVARLLDRAAGLGARLGPILLQLPPNLHCDAALLAGCLERFPEHIRVAVEPRHASWWTDEVRRVLTDHGAALCWADRGSRPVTPLWRTTDWGYVRFHAGRANPEPRYGATALRSWLNRIGHCWADEADVFVYFNNDPGAAAVSDAIALQRLARASGRSAPGPTG